MHAARKREAKVTHRETLEERRRADVEFGDDPVVVLTLGAEFLEASDGVAIRRANPSSEHQLETPFISFRHAGLPESLR